MLAQAIFQLVFVLRAGIAKDEIPPHLREHMTVHGKRTERIQGAEWAREIGNIVRNPALPRPMSEPGACAHE